MTTQLASVAAYEARVQEFQPKGGLAATNFNDLRRFVYEWFTHFEHAAPTNSLLDHLDDENMYLAFPGSDAMTSHAAFAAWYEDLIAQTLWNFHDVARIEIERTAPKQYLISFVVDWYGEVRSDSDQLDGWQSQKDSFLYHYTLRQTWTVSEADRLVIQRLIVSSGDSPSPIH
jgi:hypothetical protein